MKKGGDPLRDARLCQFRNKKGRPFRAGPASSLSSAALPPDRQVDAPGEKVKRDVCRGKLAYKHDGGMHGSTSIKIASTASRASNRLSSMKLA